MRNKILIIIIFFASLVSFSAAEADQSLVLKSGFNFLSFTGSISLTPSQFKSLDASIEDVYLYSPAAGSFLSAGENTLTALSAGKGYIVKSSSASDITISVTAAALSAIGDISLKAGFNLAGFSRMPETVKFSELMARQPEIKGMYKWSTAAGAFIQVVRNASGSIELLDGADPVMKAGESYFIDLAKDMPLNYDGVSISIGARPAEARIAFVSNRNGKNEIFTMAADGSAQTKISGHQTAVYSPAVSPDGTKVAYVVESSVNYDIYIMNIDGTGVKQLTGDGRNSWPAWSPDGTKLAYQKSQSGIWTMNADGTGQAEISVTLPANMYGLTQPCWSPDGTKIAVTGSYSTSANIYYIDVAASSLHQLSYNIGMNMGPAWSPDGAKIVFGCFSNIGSDAIYKIYVMSADGSGQKELNSSDISSFSYKYSWSPDGSRIAFSECRSGDNGYMQVYVMNSDGSGQTRLTDPLYKDNSGASFAAPSRR